MGPLGLLLVGKRAHAFLLVVLQKGRKEKGRSGTGLCATARGESETHGGKQLVEEAAFKVQAVGEAHLICCVRRDRVSTSGNSKSTRVEEQRRTRIDTLLARLNRQHPLSSNLPRHLDRLVHDRPLLDDAGDEPPLARLLGGQVAAGEDEFHRARFPDRVRQALRAAGARDHAQLQVGSRGYPQSSSC